MDRREAIKEAQTYLRALHKHGAAVRSVIPSGIFDENTEEAVKDFQKSAGLPATGVLDKTTWELLYDTYLSLRENCGCSLGIYPFETLLAGDCLSSGDRSTLVMILQVMLDTVGYCYLHIRQTVIDGYYGEETTRNVREFQEKNLLPVTGEVDLETWNCLARCYNHHIRTE